MQKNKVTDFTIYKKDYMNSHILSVREFFRQVVGYKTSDFHGRFDKYTKGWREEKKLFQIDVINKQREEILKNIDVEERSKRLISYLEQVEDSVAFIVQSKRKKIKMADGREVTVLDRDLKDMPFIKIAWDILRVATGQSTSNLDVNITDKSEVVTYELPDNKRDRQLDIVDITSKNKLKNKK
jgi:hypothetical protein